MLYLEYPTHPSTTACAEYIWIGSKGELRSKTRVIYRELDEFKTNLNKEWVFYAPEKTLNDVKDFPIWSFDGSSTGQAEGTESEVILKPCAVFKDPFRGVSDRLILCDTYYPDEIRPNSSNKRVWAKGIFDRKLEEEPWFGLDQEYFIFDLPTGSQSHRPVGFPDANIISHKLATGSQGQYYCGTGSQNSFGREIAGEHLQICIKAGIKIVGINAEAAPGQWGFQIGPCEGIDAADHLWTARYLLNRVAELHNKLINYHPNPIPSNTDLLKLATEQISLRWDAQVQSGFPGGVELLNKELVAVKLRYPEWNGSGCRTTYSTKKMRINHSDSILGLRHIYNAIDGLASKHKEHMDVQCNDNLKHVNDGIGTESSENISDDVVDRTVFIERGNTTAPDGYGYFEDRRPNSNCDPYLVTAKIFETTILNEL